MADLEIAVRYKSKPAKVALIVAVGLLPIWGILIPGALIFSFGASFLFGGGSVLNQFTGVGPALGLLLITVLGIKTVLNLADNRIVVTKFGIEFPFFLANTYGLRRNFPWAAVRDVSLFEKNGKRELILCTADGFPVYMDISCFAPDELEQLLVGIDLWAVNCEKSPTLIGLREELQTSCEGRETPSYTTMWDEELSRRFSATAYVPLEPGHVLQNGRLQVLNQLSFGGLSAVYLCQYQGRGLVILKEAVVPTGNDDEMISKALELFEREATILSKLDHPDIAKVLDHFVDAGRQYLLIEYRPGQDLSQLVKQNGPQTEQRVLQWTLKITQILEYLHGQDPPVIHRDVTPDNLVLETDGTIVMIDFGAANEFLGRATGTLVGKQSFISPEQFRGKATTQSDLYALGCTMSFLLTGAEPVPLSVSRPKAIDQQVSDEIDTLVADLTQMDLSKRIKTADECKHRILALLSKYEVLTLH